MLARDQLISRKTEKQILEESRERNRKQSKYDELVAALNSILERAIQDTNRDDDSANPVEGEIIGVAENAVPTPEQIEAEENLFKSIKNLQSKLECLVNHCRASAHRVKKEYPSRKTLNDIIRKTVFGDDDSEECKGGTGNDNNPDSNEDSNAPDVSTSDENTGGNLRKLAKRENRRKLQRNDLPIPLKLFEDENGKPFFALLPIRDVRKQTKHPRNAKQRKFRIKF